MVTISYRRRALDEAKEVLKHKVRVNVAHVRILKFCSEYLIFNGSDGVARRSKATLQSG